MLALTAMTSTGLIFGLIIAIVALTYFFPSYLKNRPMADIQFDHVGKKLDLLLEDAGIDFDPVADAMQRGDRIEAIKRYRKATGCSLSEAKKFVEDAQRSDASLSSRMFARMANFWRPLWEQPARQIGIACLAACFALLQHVDKFGPWGLFAYGALFGFGGCFFLQTNPHSQNRKLRQVDAKLDQLLNQAGVKFEPYEDLPHDVRAALQRGDRIEAIKSYRKATGCSLSEALIELSLDTSFSR